MVYPADKEDFTPVVSPEHIRDNHINELQTLLETLQDVIGTFPIWDIGVPADIGDMFISKVAVRLTWLLSTTIAELSIADKDTNLGIFIKTGGNVGVKMNTPLVALDVAGEINSTYGFYHDRGDPAAADFALGDLTEDGAWHDLDLSGIVPVRANAVALRVRYEASAINKSILFKKKGNNNAHNISDVYSQVANLGISADIIVSCDTDRKVEYLMSSPETTVLTITVKGWWK